MRAFANKNCSERGAASVLIILMLLVLVTLGAFAISAANANYKFSLRAAEWNETYYNLDAMCEEFLAALDGKLIDAHAAALRYAEGEETDAPEWLGETGRNGEITAEVYLYFADIYIKELSSVYKNMEVSPGGSMLVSLDIETETDEGEVSGIRLTARVNPPGISAARYDVVSWYEYQKEIQEVPTIQIWDGKLPF